MKITLLTSLLTFSIGAAFTHAAENPAPLKLRDGRVFVEWSILNQTATHVFVKYKGGGAKVAKELLPDDLRAGYPVDPEKAKDEAAALAEAERAGNERKAEVAAARARAAGEESAKAVARQQAVNAALESVRTEEAIKRAVDAEKAPPAFDPEPLYALVRSRAKRYYETERRNGSGATLVFKIDYEFDEPRPIPGWAGRYEITGVAHYQYYDSVWGGSFSSHVGYFSAVIARNKVIDFTPRSGPAM